MTRRYAHSGMCASARPIRLSGVRDSTSSAGASREHCGAHRLDLLEIIGDEGISGASGLQGRPGLAEALRRIENHEASVLVLFRLDRLARDLLLQETVVERLRMSGASVISVSEPDVDSHEPTRILIRQVFGAISQYEKRLLKARMAAGMRLKAARGGSRVAFHASAIALSAMSTSHWRANGRSSPAYEPERA